MEEDLGWRETFPHKWGKYRESRRSMRGLDKGPTSRNWGGPEDWNGACYFDLITDSS